MPGYLAAILCRDHGAKSSILSGLDASTQCGRGEHFNAAITRILLVLMAPQVVKVLKGICRKE